MNCKRITFRLYTVHDMDLIALESPDFSLSKAMYIALKAFCRGEYFLIQTSGGGNALQYKRRTCSFNLYLKHDKDKDIIDMLELVSSGGRNNFMRNILRMYLAVPCAQGYITEDGKDFFNQRLDVFKKDRRIVSLKTRKKTEKKKIPPPEPVQEPEYAVPESFDDIPDDMGSWAVLPDAGDIPDEYLTDDGMDALPELPELPQEENTPIPAPEPVQKEDISPIQEPVLLPEPDEVPEPDDDREAQLINAFDSMF